MRYVIIENVHHYATMMLLPENVKPQEFHIDGWEVTGEGMICMINNLPYFYNCNGFKKPAILQMLYDVMKRKAMLLR